MDGKASKQPARGSPELSAGDVKAVTGLSYRQLNEWEARGALPGARDVESGWRRFTIRDLFILLLSKELRTRFGVPVEKLGFVRNSMQAGDGDYLSAVVRLRAYGLNVLLVTDLKETFILDSDLELQFLLEAGLFSAEEPGGFIVLSCNHLIDRLFLCLKEPIRFATSPEIYKAVAECEAHSFVRDRKEFEVLRALRNNDFRTIKVTKKDGEEILLEMERELSPETDLSHLVKKDDFQTVTVARHNGKNIRLTQKITKKVSR